MGATGYQQQLNSSSSPSSADLDLSQTHPVFVSLQDEVVLLRAELMKLKAESATQASNNRITTTSAATIKANKLKAEAEKLRAKAAKMEAEANSEAAADKEDLDEEGEGEAIQFSDTEIILLTALGTVSAIGLGMFLLVATAFRSK